MKEIEEDFVPFTEALELKKLEFDEPCFAFFNILYDGQNNNYFGKLILGAAPDHLLCQKKMTYIFGQSTLLAPTYSKAFRWFRKKYELTFSIKRHYNCYNITEIRKYDVNKDLNNDYDLQGLEFKDFTTYEEAELECLRTLIEIATTGEV